MNFSNRDFELLIIDNSSSDHTKSVASYFKEKFENFNYVIEKKQGLSHARNRAIIESETNWIVYLDDDALVDREFGNVVMNNIKNDKYKIFGGVYLPWYKYGKPYWYRDSFGSNKMKYSRPTELHKPNYLSGGVMAIHKDLINKFGAFNTNIGMNGETVGYGEETELQNRLYNQGVKFLYDPNLIINHLVANQKLSVDWFFVAAFSQGRDEIITHSKKTTIWTVLSEGVIMLGLLLLYLLIYTPKLIFTNNYYIQNWLLDVFRKSAKRIGVIYSALLIMQESKFK